jgi:hypothetical protein
MSLREAMTYSLGQLRLMADAQGRLKATEWITQMRTVHVAVAAAWSEAGGRAMRDVERKLKEIIDGT